MINLLLLLVACTGNGPEDSGSDTSTHTGETGSDAIEAPFAVELPDGIVGEVSFVYTEDRTTATPEDEEVGTCPADGTTCTFTATAEGNYVVYATSSTAKFYAKVVYADENGALPDSVTWAANGCADEGWTPDAHTACANWLPGEWMMSPSGTFRTDEGDDVEVDTKFSPDVTGDGIADIVVEMQRDGGGVMTAAGAGSVFYNDTSDETFIVSGMISSDLETIQYYEWRRSDGYDNDTTLHAVE